MAEMDWMKIINAHVMWKQRLLKHISGESEELLDPAVVGRDDQCPLGKWIYGLGQEFHGVAEFEPVRVQHADFHKMAGEIVRLVGEGRRADATRLLQGDYARLSERLKHRILLLHSAVRSLS